MFAIMKTYTHQSIMPFGKYKDRKMEDVPRGYLLHLYDLGVNTGPLADYIIENIPVLRYMRDKMDKAA